MPAPPARRPSRQRGEGSIRERRRGYFEASLSLGRRSDGTYDRRYVQGRSREEVLSKLERLRALRRGDFLEPRRRALPSVGVQLAHWLRGKRATVSDASWVVYERWVALHLQPHLGAIRIDHLTPEDVRGLHATLRAPPSRLSPKTIAEVHSVLRQALDQAVDELGLPRNVAQRVKRPRQEKRPPAILTPPQLSRFWKAAAGHPLYALFWLAAHFPSRSGELRGLRRSDVDLAAGTVTVNRQLESAGDGGRGLRTKAPKSSAGRRTHALDPETVAVLRAHLDRQRIARRAQNRYLDQGLLFCTKYGTALDAHEFRRVFRLLLGRAGLPEARVHDLRHTSISALLAAGVPLPEVSQIAGHANPGVTASIYAHAVPRSTGAAARELAAFYRRGAAGSDEPDRGASGASE